MNYYKVLVEKITENLKLPYDSPNIYYKKEDGKKYFDVLINKITMEYVIQAFNKEAVQHIFSNDIFKILSIELIKTESTIFDSLERVQPNWAKELNKIKLNSEIIDEKSIEVIRPIIFDHEGF